MDVTAPGGMIDVVIQTWTASGEIHLIKESIGGHSQGGITPWLSVRWNSACCEGLTMLCLIHLSFHIFVFKSDIFNNYSYIFYIFKWFRNSYISSTYMVFAFKFLKMIVFLFWVLNNQRYYHYPMYQSYNYILYSMSVFHLSQWFFYSVFCVFQKR